MKKASILILTLFMIACGGGVKLEQNPALGAGNVLNSLRNQYLSSVAVNGVTGKVIGSGTVIRRIKDEKMLVLTAHHVVDDFIESGMPVVLRFPNGETRTMNVAKHDKTRDLALLKSVENEKETGPYVELSDEYPLIGESVIVIGAPNGDSYTVTNGIISNIFVNKNKVTQYRFTNAIWFGNSGGGIFRNDKLIGVVVSTQFIVLPIGVLHVPGSGFASALSEIKKFL